MPMEPPPAAGNHRPSLSAAAASSPVDLKKKAVSCLNKLSDRDTFAGASAELETMAMSLSPTSSTSIRTSTSRLVLPSASQLPSTPPRPSTPAHLQRVLLCFLKLLRSYAFKAKPAPSRRRRRPMI